MRTLVRTVIGTAFVWTMSVPSVAAQTAAPRILIDLPLRAVEYQLARLSNADLARLERRDDDVRYRPVYVALLTRRGLGRDLRDEALAALVKMDRTGAPEVLLQALAKVPVDDEVTAGRLLSLLFAETPSALRDRRGVFLEAVDVPSQAPAVLSAAYGGMLLADGVSSAAWQMAAERGHVRPLVQALPYLPWSAGARPMQADVFSRVAAFVEDSGDPDVRRAATLALPAIRADAATFRLLAGEVVSGADMEQSRAAVRALHLVPRDQWPAAEVGPLAHRVVSLVRDTPELSRADADTLAAIELGEKLAAAMPAADARAVRRDLRALGVRVIRIGTVPEELRFDLKWFVVEAGKPVQIVLSNPDAMPHNLIVGRPGTLDEIGVLGSAMPMPTDPNVKPFVPNTPDVLYATGLVNFEESARLSFTAPREPGEYPFVCTFPGHWLRMYGVMLVVSDLDAWEAKPAPPLDPMTKQPF